MPYLNHLVSGPLQTNAYIIGSNESQEAVLIDSPPQCYDAVQSYIARTQRSIAAVLITHPHLDHILDAHLFVKDGIPIVAMKEAEQELAKPQTMGLFPEPEQGFNGVKVNRFVKNGDTFEYAGLNFKVFSVPGHCHGSAAYYVEAESWCFVGDLLFHGSIGRTDLPGGDFDLLAESIQNHIYTLKNETLLFPGHGPKTEVGSEKRSNPYVRG